MGLLTLPPKPATWCRARGLRHVHRYSGSGGVARILGTFFGWGRGPRLGSGGRHRLPTMRAGWVSRLRYVVLWTSATSYLPSCARLRTPLPYLPLGPIHAQERRNALQSREAVVPVGRDLPCSPSVSLRGSQGPLQDRAHSVPGVGSWPWSPGCASGFGVPFALPQRGSRASPRVPRAPLHADLDCLLEAVSGHAALHAQRRQLHARGLVHGENSPGRGCASPGPDQDRWDAALLPACPGVERVGPMAGAVLLREGLEAALHAANSEHPTAVLVGGIGRRLVGAAPEG